jgi:hypothetical protein
MMHSNSRRSVLADSKTEPVLSTPDLTTLPVVETPFAPDQLDSRRSASWKRRLGEWGGLVLAFIGPGLLRECALLES